MSILEDDPSTKNKINSPTGNVIVDGMLSKDH